MLYKPREPHTVFTPVGLVAAGTGYLEVWTASGAEVAHGETECRKLLERYAGFTLFSHSSFKTIRTATGADGWQILRWAKRDIVWMQLGSTRILGSRFIFANLHPADALQALLGIEADAQAYGIQLGSTSSVARQLWQLTLPEPIRFSGRDIGKLGFFGGRKDVREFARGTTLSNVLSVDIHSAYPAAMTRAPFPTRLIRTRSPHVEGEGISLAEVRMPNLPWAPLPERLRSNLIRWRSGRTLQGWYSHEELRAARDAGSDVIPIETYEGTREYEPFAEWSTVIEPLRTQPGVAGKYWKVVSNSLWGIFLMSNVGAEYITLGSDGKPVTIDGFPRKRPPTATAAYVGTIIGARVRSQVFAEALGYGWNDGAVYVDTDGVLLMEHGKLPIGVTDVPDSGGWSVRRQMKHVLIKGTQAFGWWDSEGKEHVSIAGVPNATMHDLQKGNWGNIVTGR